MRFDGRQLQYADLQFLGSNSGGNRFDDWQGDGAGADYCVLSADVWGEGFVGAYC
jgi:hypothetical protein